MRVITALIAAGALAGCAADTERAAPEPTTKLSGAGRAAQATMEARSNSGASGYATLRLQPDGWTRITLTMSGASPGLHGFHIHEKGDCSASDASSAGGHFNPLNTPHGAPGPHSHVGDLGNVRADRAGNISHDRIYQLPYAQILGKALVLHSQADDFVSQPAGDAGDRISCGVILAAD